MQLAFTGADNKPLKWVVSGIDLDQIPQLQSRDYSDGIYMPLGFGTPFTQSYADLTNQPPAASPFFSVVLDGKDRIIDYRKDIGINGLVMHRRRRECQFAPPVSNVL